ncbi:MAG TPA: saccharopine dehydrogenase family protein [Gammaproteobacteria bacterium]|nr:saccharopine dehydrogenase family protein [Gammaproteobacteria bacterium]
MHKLLILGAGKIGSLITSLLANSGSYNIHLCDINIKKGSSNYTQLKSLVKPPHKLTLTGLDVSKRDALNNYISKHSFNAIISSLPYFCNKSVVNAAVEHGISYFDLTEDVESTQYVILKSTDQHQAFVPQCGLAPGFISIVAHQLMQEFDQLETVKMRVGALPINQNNTLKYSLTWSTDGLINEYGNACSGIVNKQVKELLPLEGYETISIDGLQYEAFNTSGGLGTLVETYKDRINNLNYKTLRYPGHCEMVHLLMNDLKLNEDRSTLKRILENAVPKTLQDVVIIYVSVSGYKKGELFENNFVKKIYPGEINDRLWSAIQITTACGICGVVDIVLNNPEKYQGLVRQEDISFNDFIHTPFGQYYSV